MKHLSKQKAELPYIPATPDERQAMLRAIGVGDVDDLFRVIPEKARLNRELCLPGPDTETEILAYFRALAGENSNLDDNVCFLGGGIYDHFIPEVVPTIIGRSEFYTSYTPYQAEISQGMLQAIYEYQSLVCRLTGMDVSNASMYDGGTSLAEAAIMACDETDRSEILVSSGVNPSYRAALATYVSGMGLSIREVPIINGLTDLDALASMVGPSIGAVILQQPNFLGSIEQAKRVGEIAKSAGALFVASIDPISLGMLTPPGEYGADIVTGEGQALGLPPAFGGPLLGIFATKSQHIWRLPGRLVGATTDTQGRRGYVLTLQTREQHIRRERATSNICTNQTLMALAAAVYVSALGPGGLREVSHLCFQKAHYAREQLLAAGMEPVWDAPFFKEFVVRCPVAPEDVNAELLRNGIVGGLPIESHFPEMRNCMLWCVTEKRTKAEIDRLASVVRNYVRNQTRAAHI
jgi:glycine dehydrogenase subunit 1